MKHKALLLLTALLFLGGVKASAATTEMRTMNVDDSIELMSCELIIKGNGKADSHGWILMEIPTVEKIVPSLCLRVPESHGFSYIHCEEEVLTNTYKILEKAGLPKSLKKKHYKPGKVTVPDGEEDKKWELHVQYFDKERKKIKECNLAGGSIYAENSTFVLELYQYFQSLAEEEVRKNDPEIKKQREAEAKAERLRNFPKGRILTNSYRYAEGRGRYIVDWTVAYRSDKYLVIYQENGINTSFGGSFTCEEDLDKVLHEIYKEGDITSLEKNSGIKEEPGIRVLDASSYSFSLTFEGGPKIQSAGQFGTESMHKATEYLRTLAEKYLGEKKK